MTNSFYILYLQVTTYFFQDNFIVTTYFFQGYILLCTHTTLCISFLLLHFLTIRYYYNKITKQSCWEKPLELMTPLEVRHCSNFSLFLILYHNLNSLVGICFYISTWIDFVHFMDADGSRCTWYDRSCLCKSSFYLHVPLVCRCHGKSGENNNCSISSLWRRFHFLKAGNNMLFIF